VELLRAIEKVKITRLINSLPNGLDTVIMKDELHLPKNPKKCMDPEEHIHISVDSDENQNNISTRWLSGMNFDCEKQNKNCFFKLQILSFEYYTLLA
jgi:hypothetical protein